MFKRLLLCLILASCGSNSPQEAEPINTAKLDSKLAGYLNRIESRRGHSGWVDEDDCDGLLFNSLLAAARTPGINLWLAFDGEKWFRTPAKDCYPERSGSDISKDMITGLLVYSAIAKDRAIPESILSYGRANNWYMGDGAISRTWLSPNLRHLAALIVKELGGEEHRDLLEIPITLLPGSSGYAAHLDILILLAKAEFVPLNDFDLAAIQVHHNRNPKNSLFSYMFNRYKSGNYAEAIETLLDRLLFPGDRLPESKDRCAAYLWQREIQGNWTSCGQGKKHSGIDFIFASYLILRHY